MAEIKKWKVTEPYLDLHCGLGEAPYHERENNRLRFVDIKKKQLHVIDLAEGPSSLYTVQLDMPVGVTADIEGIPSTEKILIGGKHGIAVFDRKAETYQYLKRFYDSPERDERLRSNDGAVDPRGRFWIGTMNDFWVGAPQAEGTLFRFDSDLERHIIYEGLTIPNGVGWSPDHKTLYFTHSSEGKIYAYDYDVETGDVSNKRVFWELEGEGDPDGFKMDSEGYIWQAVYGQGRVLRLSPDAKIVGEITLPTRCITCPAFVGEDLFISSAAEEDPEKYPESAKYGGGLFKVNVGVTGLQDFKFKLAKSV
jgi:sugar lactone lactonase YvrE